MRLIIQPVFDVSSMEKYLHRINNWDKPYQGRISNSTILFNTRGICGEGVAEV